MKSLVLNRKSLLVVILAVVSRTLLFAQGTTGSDSSTGLIVTFVVLLFVVAAGLYFFFKKKNESALNEIKGKTDSAASELAELRRQKEELNTANIALSREINEKDTEISTLAGNKRELEQILVAKIKENDSILREAADKEEQAKKQVQVAETIQDNFFVETIHEMRTPLSLVLGTLSMVVQNKTPEEEVATQLLSAYRNTLALEDLADQLIGTRHNNDVASYLRVARYDVVDISRQICDLFIDWIAMNNVDFQITAQSEVLWVWLDRRKMEYALRTLLSNALKNTFVYGKVIFDISIEQREGISYCKLIIQDEGLDELENARRGLRQIVDMIDDLGGIYECDSSANGTAYNLMIPLGKKHLLERRVEFVEPEGDLVKLNEKQKEEISQLIQIIPQKKTTGKKLLVIDDSDQIRWFLKHVFSKEYQILEARNGEEGVNMALQELPDLVLCDVMMPIKDGFDTCREIKSDSRTAQTPVVMLTAKVESEDVIKGIEAGADDYITKPFDVEILRSKVLSLLKRRDQLKHYYTRSLIAADPNAGGDPDGKTPSNPFMEAVIRNIEKHLDDSTFEAKILAESLNMSLPTLYRKIKQHSDCSILELTRTVRLKKAAELILTQQHSVQEVAELVGFNDTATFRKRFTEQYGVTPSQYGQPN